MTEETTVTTEGQADAAPSGESSKLDPITGNVQQSDGTAASQQATDTKDKTESQKTEQTVKTEVETPQFYDPKEVPAELQGSFKRMQKSYTQAMQTANSHKEKVAAFDQFMIDPIASIQKLATEHGYNLTKGEAAQVVQATEQEFNPTTWDEVMTKAEERAEVRIMAKLRPLLGDMQQVKKTQIESLLDDSFPEWRAHETEMTALLSKHPTLANDPSMLVQLAVPKEVRESQATQKALDILQKKAEAAQVGPGSTTTKTATPKPDKPLSFNEAVAFAKEKIAREGKAA